jgi:hypothetical protein
VELRGGKGGNVIDPSGGGSRRSSRRWLWEAERFGVRAVVVKRLLFFFPLSDATRLDKRGCYIPVRILNMVTSNRQLALSISEVNKR